MSEIRVTVMGGPELLARLKSVSQAVANQGVRDGLSGAANVVEGAAKQNIVEKDIIDTGALLNSVQAQQPHLTSQGSEVEVRVGQEYGIHHEYGTIYITARPFMRPAVDEHIPEIERAVEAGILRALRGQTDG